MSWKDDVIHEICSRYCGPRAEELGDPAAVRQILDQWVPLTVDEAEVEIENQHRLDENLDALAERAVGPQGGHPLMAWARQIDQAIVKPRGSK